MHSFLKDSNLLYESTSKNHLVRYNSIWLVARICPSESQFCSRCFSKMTNQCCGDDFFLKVSACSLLKIWNYRAPSSSPPTSFYQIYTDAQGSYHTQEKCILTLGISEPIRRFRADKLSLNNLELIIMLVTVIRFNIQYTFSLKFLHNLLTS